MLRPTTKEIKDRIETSTDNAMQLWKFNYTESTEEWEKRMEYNAILNFRRTFPAFIQIFLWGEKV